MGSTTYSRGAIVWYYGLGGGHLFRGGHLLEGGGLIKQIRDAHFQLQTGSRGNNNNCFMFCPVIVSSCKKNFFVLDIIIGQMLVWNWLMTNCLILQLCKQACKQIFVFYATLHVYFFSQLVDCRLISLLVSLMDLKPNMSFGNRIHCILLPQDIFGCTNYSIKWKTKE